MTFREKWELDHPDERFNPFMTMCPFAYGYEDNPENKHCNHKGLGCPECWERNIDEDRIARPVNDSVDATKGVLRKSGSEPWTPTIKDSGDRTQFETGAVRDMREGKGRCDLMPLEVVALCYSRFSDDLGTDGDVFRWIAEFQKTNDTEYLIRALDSFDGYDAWSAMFLEVAKHFEEGAKKYGESNWRRGIPTYCYIDSAIRHYLKWLRGDKDEPHDRAFVWNLMCCIWEVDYHNKEDDNEHN